MMDVEDLPKTTLNTSNHDCLSVSTMGFDSVIPLFERKMLFWFGSLFRRNSTINSGLYFCNRHLAVSIYKGCNIKRFIGMVEHVVRNGSGRFTKDITEEIIKF